MKRYSEYKDSGVKWIGEIPGHWKSVPFRRIAKVQCNLVHPFDNLEMLQISPDSIEKDSGKIIKIKTVAEANIDSDNHRFYKGQILYSKIRPLLNKVTIAPDDGLCSADMYPISTEEKTEFIKYYMLSKAFLSSVKNIVADRVKMPKINQDELKETRFVIPPLPEQEAIVTYLDTKVAKIDEYISIAEKKIAALEELKQTIIAEAVTRGIHKDVPMKDSGVKWIGMIPEHWKIRKMKFVFKERSEKGYPNEPVLSATQSNGVIPQSMYENRVVVVNKGFENLKLVCKGDFVISLRSFQGGIEYAYYRGIISAAYTILTKSAEFLNEGYVKNLFKSHPFVQLLKTCVTGIREGQNINYSLLRDKYIPVPPLAEQQEIVTYMHWKN